MTSKHVANLTSWNNIQGNLLVSGDLIIGGVAIKFPLVQGADKSYFRANGGGITSWTVPRLVELDDVVVSSPAAGHALTYNGSAWINSDIFASPTMTGTVTINGDLNVTGTATYAEVKDLKVTDNFIIINDGETGSGVTLGDAGVRIDRGLATDYIFQFLESDQTFRVGQIGSTVALAAREDSPVVGGIPVWNGTTFMLDTANGLTAAEATQLKNINSVAIGNTQWGYLGALDQTLITTASPTWASVTLSSTANQIILGSGNTTTLSATAPAASRIYTFPDMGSNATVAFSSGSSAQTFTNSNSFSTGTTFNSASNQIVIKSGTSPGYNITADVSATERTYHIVDVGSNSTFAMIDGSFDQIWGNNNIFQNGISVGNAQKITIIPGTLAADRIYTLPDAGLDAEFVMTRGFQEILGLKGFQDVQIMESLLLPNPSGGTQTNLDHNEVLSLTGTISGDWAAVPTITVKLARTGNKVTLVTEPIFGTLNSASTLTFSAIIPDRMEPTNQISQTYMGRLGATEQITYAAISNQITFHYTVADHTWPSGVVGIDSFGSSWVVD